MSNSYLLGKRVAYKFHEWETKLFVLLCTEKEKAHQYDHELIRGYFAQGLTPEETLKQLRSELPLPEDEEEENL